MKKPRTPFPTTGYAGPEYFCDREAELSSLINNMNGGNSTTLIALRRMGKTALIRHLFHYLDSEINKIYLDTLSWNRGYLDNQRHIHIIYDQVHS